MDRPIIHLSIQEQALIADDYEGTEWELVDQIYQYTESGATKNLYICKHPEHGLYGFMGWYQDEFLTNWYSAQPLRPMVPGVVVVTQYNREDGRALDDREDAEYQDDK